MKKLLFSLTAIVLWSINLCISQCTTCTTSYTVSSSNDMSFTTGTYCFIRGTYTGNITSVASGVTICVGPDAVFKPQNVNGGLYGTLNNYGEVVLPNVSLKNGFQLNSYSKTTFSSGVNLEESNIQITNSGELTVNGNVNYNGSNCKIINTTGGNMIINSTLPIGDNGTLDNSGNLKIGGDLNLNYGNSSFYNRGGSVARIATNFNPKGKVINDGLLVVSGLTNVNTATAFTNNCRYVSVNGLNNNDPSYFINNGLLWCPSNKIQNNSNATFELGSKSVMRGVDFGNDGKVTGSGKMYFTGTTTQQGTFTGLSSSAYITFWDATQTGSQVFDNENRAYSNVVRASFVPADTNTFDCSATVLPIQLAGFDAQAVQNKAVLLTWQSVSEINLKSFTIERSANANGNSWQSVGSVVAAGNSSSVRSYQFTDKAPLSGTSYYRLRSADADGKETISAIRQVNLSGKTSSLQVYPTLVQKGGVIKVITTEALRYQLLDMSGKTILSGNLVNGVSVLNINANAGSYILETIDNSSVRQYAKIVVQ